MEKEGERVWKYRLNPMRKKRYTLKTTYKLAIQPSYAERIKLCDNHMNNTLQVTRGWKSGNKILNFIGLAQLMDSLSGY